MEQYIAVLFLIIIFSFVAINYYRIEVFKQYEKIHFILYDEMSQHRSSKITIKTLVDKIKGMESRYKWLKKYHNEYKKRNSCLNQTKGTKHTIKCECGREIVIYTNIYDNSNSGQTDCECGAHYLIN